MTRDGMTLVPVRQRFRVPACVMQTRLTTECRRCILVWSDSHGTGRLRSATEAFPLDEPCLRARGDCDQIEPRLADAQVPAALILRRSLTTRKAGPLRSNPSWSRDAGVERCPRGRCPGGRWRSRGTLTGARDDLAVDGRRSENHERANRPVPSTGVAAPVPVAI
jgi:hypothetical protein